MLSSTIFPRPFHSNIIMGATRSPPILEDEDLFSCIHCDFACSSESEMTQHRWEEHPLLMKKKKHLMSSSRKRPNSESASNSPPNEESFEMEKMRAKRVASVESVMTSQAGLSPIECGSEVETGDSSKASGFVKGALHSKQRQTFGNRNDEIAQNTGRLVANSAAAAPLVAFYDKHMIDRITSLLKPGVSEALPPKINMDALLRHTPPPSASPSLTATSQWGAPGFHNPALDATYISGDKLSHGFVAAASTDGYKFASVLPFQCASGDLVYSMPPHGRNSLGPRSGSVAPHNNSLTTRGNLVCPSHLMPESVASFVPCEFPIHFPPAALLQASRVDNMFRPPPASMPHLVAPASMPQHLARASLPMHAKPAASVVAPQYDSKLSTLSSVASKILERDLHKSVCSSKDQSRNEDARHTQEVVIPMLPNNPFRSFHGDGISPIFKPSSSPTKQNQAQRSSAIFVKQPPVNVDSVNLLRHRVSATVLDDAHVRSLEDAVLKTDYCDSSTRTSVMPMRCEDGKWKMVRTKRVAGAWLIQMPGNDTTSVVLPQNSASPLYTSAHSYVPGDVCKRLLTEGRVHPQKPAHETNGLANNCAIRNLLLQKS